MIGTRGRALDHIGFEITNLDEFARKLAAQGIMTTVRNIPAINTKVGFVTDPWGTLIELSEGLRAIPYTHSTHRSGCANGSALLEARLDRRRGSRGDLSGYVGYFGGR